MITILCAAIWYKELPLLKPEVLEPRGFSPYNVDKGIVFCGWRHSNCIYQKVAVTGLRDSESGENVQGFLTSDNRFVDREEGAVIALNAGQIKEQKKRLFSEDLY
jgi:hypothetical protein